MTSTINILNNGVNTRVANHLLDSSECTVLNNGLPTSGKIYSTTTSTYIGTGGYFWSIKPFILYPPSTLNTIYFIAQSNRTIWNNVLYYTTKEN